MDELAKLMEKVAKENQAREAKDAKQKRSAEKIATEAAFLKRWAKGKPIVRQRADARFWAAGKWMTQMDFGLAEQIAAAGYATLTGNPRMAGATLLMK